jgi:hypothetical protein
MQQNMHKLYELCGDIKLSFTEIAFSVRELEKAFLG